MGDFSQHLEQAQKEHGAYLDTIEKAKRAHIASKKDMSPTFGHYTFDFAQQVFLPYYMPDKLAHRITKYPCLCTSLVLC